jgi:hypothetical protein
MNNPFEKANWSKIHRGYRYSAEFSSGQRAVSDALRDKSPDGNEIVGRIIGEGKNMLASYLRNKNK